MSEFKTVYGFGGVRFVYPNWLDVTFSYLLNKGAISFEPRYFRKETPNHVKIIKLIGYEVQIVTSLTNMVEDDYLNFGYLTDIVNESARTGTPVTIYPRFDATSQYAFSVECFLKSKVKYDDLAEIEAGQTISLEWEAKALLTELPFFVNQLQNDYMLNEDGSFILDESGNKIMVER